MSVSMAALLGVAFMAGLCAGLGLWSVVTLTLLRQLVEAAMRGGSGPGQMGGGR